MLEEAAVRVRRVRCAINGESVEAYVRGPVEVVGVFGKKAKNARAAAGL